MQCQEIIEEDGKCFLVIAIPVWPPELFSYGFVSSTGKSFVFRKYNLDKSVMFGYQHIKIDQTLIKGRIVNSGRFQHFHESNFVTHTFNGINLPCMKISVSKSFK